MIAMTTKGEKFAGFCADNHLTFDDLLEMSTRDNMCQGICTNPDCDFVCVEIESDQEFGFCEKCENNTVVSVLVLAEII